MVLSSVSPSPASVAAPVPGVVAGLASAAGASFLCVRPSARSFSGWVACVLFGSGSVAASFGSQCCSEFGFPFCAVRSAGSWFSVSVPVSVSWFLSPVGSLPCLWCRLSPVSLSLRSLLASCSSVGFSGSRSLSGSGLFALRALLSLVPAFGCRVSVGCAAGCDRLVRVVLSSRPGLLVFSALSGRFGSGRSAFARRSVAVVRSVSPRSGLLVVVPGSAVPPAGCVPRRSFRGCGSGSWGSAALALGLRRRVLVWLPAGACPPAWASVSWSCVAPVSGGSWWLGVPS